MKQFYNKPLILVLAAVFIFSIGSAFLTSSPKEVSAGTVKKITVSLPDDQSEGEFIFEYKGKKYKSNTTEEPGGVTLSPDKSAYVVLVADHIENKRSFRLQLSLTKIKEFKTGKYVLTTMKDNLDDHQKDGFVIVYSGPLADSSEYVEATPADINGNSETGTITFTGITHKVADHSVLVSGSFEFSGKNENEEAADKTFTIKGSFKNYKINRFAPPGLKE